MSDSVVRIHICLCSSAAPIKKLLNYKFNRRALKTARKRLYFSDFKERLVHFNGTVVTLILKTLDLCTIFSLQNNLYANLIGQMQDEKSEAH